jgi:hypothetical protein
MKTIKAVIVFKDGDIVESSASKKKGRWLIGGDVPQATTKCGGTIFIHSKGNIYLLKGNRLIFQDCERPS